MTTTDLITRAITLQKCHSHLSVLHLHVMLARLQAAIWFERDHVATIRNFNFQMGDLVLVHNMAIKKSLNCKMHPQYIRPLVIISRKQRRSVHHL